MATSYSSVALIDQGRELITLVSGQGVVKHLYIPFVMVAQRQPLIDAEVAELDANDAAYLAWQAAMAAQDAADPTPADPTTTDSTPTGSTP